MWVEFTSDSLSEGGGIPIQKRIAGYAGGLLIAGAALGLRLWLGSPGAHDCGLMVFALAIVLSGWLFGFGPSVETALVCGLGAVGLPGLSPSVPQGLLGGSLYLLTSLGICLIVGRLRSTRLALERGARQLNRACEQAVRARGDAERASEAKERFLHVISHELRNPLQSIAVSVDVLRHELNGVTATPSLRRINLAVRALSGIIDDLFDSTRIATGQLRLARQSMDLVAAVRSAVELMTPIADDKEIKLRPDFQAGSVPLIGDPERLQACVCNLLGNAIKFSAEGGDVMVSLRQTGNSAEVRITDHGGGIDAEFMPRIFDRFAQSELGTQRRGGLGLGLSIVKHVVELHGGTMAAQSAGKGQGASLAIILPTSFAAHDAAARHQS